MHGEGTLFHFWIYISHAPRLLLLDFGNVLILASVRSFISCSKVPFFPGQVVHNLLIAFRCWC